VSRSPASFCASGHSGASGSTTSSAGARITAAKQRHLPGVALARQLLGRLHHLGQLQHQRGAVGTQRIDGAGVDQRLQRAPVELGRIDAPAEIQQVDERSVALAFGDDGFAGAAADALDRAQAVAHGGVVVGDEHVARSVDVRRQHGQLEAAAFVQETNPPCRCCPCPRTAPRP
jgi:hypothetical protein